MFFVRNEAFFQKLKKCLPLLWKSLYKDYSSVHQDIQAENIVLSSKYQIWDFPAYQRRGHMGSISGPGRIHMPRGYQARAPQLLSQCSRAQQLQLDKACTQQRTPSTARKKERKTSNSCLKEKNQICLPPQQYTPNLTYSRTYARHKEFISTCEVPSRSLSSGQEVVTFNNEKMTPIRIHR